MVVNKLKLIYLLPIILIVFSKAFNEMFVFPKTILLIFLFSFLIFYTVFERKKIQIYNLKFLIILLIFMLFQGLFVVNLKFLAAADFLFFILILVFISQKYDYSKKIYVMILNFFAVFIAVYVIFQAFGIDLFFYTAHLSVYERLNSLFSTLGNKNYVGEFLMCVFLLNWGFRLRYKWFNYLYFFVMFLTFSRSVILFLFVFTVFNFVKNKDKKLFLIFITILLLFVLTGGILGYYHDWQFVSMFNFSGKNSIGQRIYIWLAGLEIFKNYMFSGVGAGHFSEAFNYYQYLHLFRFDYSYFCKTNHAHNEIIHILAEYGIAGSAILYMFFLPLFRKIKGYGRFFFLFIYLFYQSMFSFPLRLPSVWIAIFPALNFLVINSGKIYVFKMKKLFSVLLVYFLTANIIGAIIAGVSDYYLKKGFNAEEYVEKDYYFSQALFYNFNSYEPHFNLAKLSLSNDKFDKAMYHSEESLKFSKNPLIFYYRGLINEGMGNRDEAIEDLEKFVTFFPVSYKGYYNLYMLYRDVNEEKAQHYFELYNIFVELQIEHTEL